jgi:hypothetical protein
MMDGERGTKIDYQVLLVERIGIKKIHQELMGTLGAMPAGRLRSNLIAEIQNWGSFMQ